MKHILFFALKEDILPILEKVESSCSLKYVRIGQFSEPNQQYFLRGSAIPDLGKASADSSINCETYLVMASAMHVHMRPIMLADGGARHSVDQLLNSDSVTFTAGGIWTSDVVLHGRIATVSDSLKSQELMKLFSSAFRKKFKKVKSYWVGPNAKILLDSGKRLTMAVQSPSDFDLIA